MGRRNSTTRQHDATLQRVRTLRNRSRHVGLPHSSSVLASPRISSRNLLGRLPLGRLPLDSYWRSRHSSPFSSTHSTAFPDTAHAHGSTQWAEAHGSTAREGAALAYTVRWTQSPTTPAPKRKPQDFPKPIFTRLWFCVIQDVCTLCHSIPLWTEWWTGTGPTAQHNTFPSPFRAFGWWSSVLTEQAMPKWGVQATTDVLCVRCPRSPDQ